MEAAKSIHFLNEKTGDTHLAALIVSIEAVEFHICSPRPNFLCDRILLGWIEPLVGFFDEVPHIENINDITHIAWIIHVIMEDALHLPLWCPVVPTVNDFGQKFRVRLRLLDFHRFKNVAHH
uniref:Uncharacterized protein n=1 Tax=Magnetospirillum gryphiswaldense TaxID=55518 RepID=A4U0D6_9PROT|nr:hypothetical protein MGR_0379 [Magnetospirillum gryphiswaldense MSR-1]